MDMEKKRQYGKAAPFFVLNQFFERFTFFGISIILPLYLRDVLQFSDDSATTIYHLFSLVALCTPIVGGILADSYLGKYKTIFYFSIVYGIGAVLLTLTTIPPLNIPTGFGVVTSLILVATGSGIIKPVINAYGGDQFLVPEEEKERESFFSVLFGFVCAGMTLTIIVTPILRNDVTCFGESSCYATGFGLPAVFMLISILIFISGTPFYKNLPLEENIVMKSVKCIFHALSKKIACSGKAISKSHWLDYAEDTYQKNLISDIKAVLKILILYLPLPIYWALFDQQVSRWTFQASRMDGSLFGGYSIKPDQFQVMNAILTLLFIPLSDKVIYPVLAKCGLLKKPLQRLTTGCFLGTISFVICGLVELKIEDSEHSDSKVHMVWLLPQYFVISLSEVMLAVTLMEFSYAQAPASMKSFLQSVWLVTSGLGNIFVIIVAEVKFFESQAYEFFLFAGLNFIDSIVFIILAIYYQPSPSPATTARKTTNTKESQEGVENDAFEAPTHHNMHL